MPTPEYGHRPSDLEIDSDDQESMKLDELREDINKIKSECAHVYEDPDNGEKLDQLLADAEEFYDVNEEGWQKLLRETKQNLMKAGDDAEKIDDILRDAQTEASSELM